MLEQVSTLAPAQAAGDDIILEVTSGLLPLRRLGACPVAAVLA